MKNKKVIVFDLDDTLMYELDFLKSAYKEIARVVDISNEDFLFEKMLNNYFLGNNVFQMLKDDYPNFEVQDLLQLYRNHYPQLTLDINVETVLNFCKNKGYKIGLISDGRSKTQRNKLKALEIETFFDLIVISEEFGSEKPTRANFEVFHQYKANEYIYVADNTNKDFITPNVLGWTSICLRDEGVNIHKQDFRLKKEFLPKMVIENIIELVEIIN